MLASPEPHIAVILLKGLTTTTLGTIIGAIIGPVFGPLSPFISAFDSFDSALGVFGLGEGRAQGFLDRVLGFFVDVLDQQGQAPGRAQGFEAFACDARGFQEGFGGALQGPQGRGQETGRQFLYADLKQEVFHRQAIWVFM